MEERIQKILARAGLGSRRTSEELIAAGRVTVNGRVASLGDKADPQTDRIEVDHRPVAAPEEQIYIAMYKPRGVLSTVDAPDPRQTVRDLVDVSQHVYPVGRLDVDSEGLILLTNDGELANRLTHPRYGHEKEYRVLVARRPDEQQLETWRRGVILEDGYKTAPADVRIEGLAGRGTWLRIIMREGRKRQIRETGSLLGLPVVRIIRVRIGTLQLGRLKPKEWRILTPAEVASLKGRPKPAGRPARSPTQRSSGSPRARTSGKSPTYSKKPNQSGPARKSPSRPKRRRGTQS